MNNKIFSRGASIILRPRDVKMGNCRLIRAEMKGCKVRYWIVGETDMRMSRILCTTCMYGG